jgi:O-methyltransferase
MYLRIKKFLKDFFLFFPITFLVLPVNRILLFVYYYNKLIRWIHRHKNELILCDFYSPLRNYDKRYRLYQTVVDHFQLSTKKLAYLEFGVASGKSFQWWLAHNTNEESCFWGFDTFEGLPENWGGYQKGDMAFVQPSETEDRAQFVKGLFQDSLPSFLTQKKETISQEDVIRIIHLDADLYSSTAFVLSQLYAYLKPGDIILFDEFNVPLHEFRAYDEFTRNFYLPLKPVAAVNNFYQTAFVVGIKK